MQSGIALQSLQRGDHPLSLLVGSARCRGLSSGIREVVCPVHEALQSLGELWEWLGAERRSREGVDGSREARVERHDEAGMSAGVHTEDNAQSKLSPPKVAI